MASVSNSSAARPWREKQPRYWFEASAARQWREKHRDDIGLKQAQCASGGKTNLNIIGLKQVWRASGGKTTAMLLV